MTISVVVPSYNHERFLLEAMESVFAQTLAADEVIIIDDASSDGSPAIAQEYADRATVVLSEQNRGTYPTLNAAIERASGEWIAILNSDDAWEPEKLALQMESLEGREFSYTNGHFVDDRGESTSHPLFGARLFSAPSGRMVERLIFHNHCYPSSVLFRKELWERAGRFREDLRCLGDWDLFLRMADLTEFSFVDSDLVRYRLHAEQATIMLVKWLMDEDVIVRETRILAREAELLAAAPDRRAMRLALAHSAAALGTGLHLQGNASRARRLYLHSLRLNPFRGKSLLRLMLAVVLPKISKP